MCHLCFCLSGIKKKMAFLPRGGFEFTIKLTLVNLELIFFLGKQTLKSHSNF